GEDRLQSRIGATAPADITLHLRIVQTEEAGQLVVVLAGQRLRSGEAGQQAAIRVEVELHVEARQDLAVVMLVVVPEPAAGIERRIEERAGEGGLLDARTCVSDVLARADIAQAGIGGPAIAGEVDLDVRRAVLLR